MLRFRRRKKCIRGISLYKSAYASSRRVSKPRGKSARIPATYPHKNHRARARYFPRVFIFLSSFFFPFPLVLNRKMRFLVDSSHVVERLRAFRGCICTSHVKRDRKDGSRIEWRREDGDDRLGGGGGCLSSRADIATSMTSNDVELELLVIFLNCAQCHVMQRPYLKHAR